MSELPQIDRRIRKLRRQFKLNDKLTKVKNTMYQPETKTPAAKTASSTLHDMASVLLAQLEKRAFVPGQEIGQMDPASMGMPPGMDPSMMGGMPPGMDPSMMGGMPPGMDPSMMQGAPMDPSMDPAMAGAPPAPPAPPAAPAAPAADTVPIEDFQQLQDQVEALEKTMMDLLDMVEKTKILKPDEPGQEAQGAAPGAVQQDMAAPMGGPMSPGANAAMMQLRPGQLNSPDALSGLLARLNPQQ